MNFLYSLYDALVSISVPSDKARAVVDAMERDMSRDFAALDLTMTVKVGSMIFVGVGLTIAVLRLWT